MPRLRIGVAIVLLLSGCSKSENFVADLSYVRASGLGYRNAALYTAGYLFLWDTGSNRLSELENNIPLERITATENPTTLKSTSISGVSIEGNFGTADQKVAAEAAFSKKVEFTAENALREKYKSTITGLATAYKAGVDAGEDMRGRWYVAEATTPKSRLRYVLVTGLVRAGKATVSVGGKSGTEVGKLSISVPNAGEIKVGVDRGSLVDCSGQSAPCFFEPTVLKPYVAENGNLNFRVDSGASREQLSAAFQKM